MGRREVPNVMRMAIRTPTLIQLTDWTWDTAAGNSVSQFIISLSFAQILLSNRDVCGVRAGELARNCKGKLVGKREGGWAIKI